MIFALLVLIGVAVVLYWRVGRSETRSTAPSVERAVRELRRALDLEPTNRYAIESLAEIYQDSGRPEAARELLETAAEEQPRAAWPLVMLASLEIERGELDEVSRYLDRALEIEPDNRRAFELLADLATAAGEPPLWSERLLHRALEAHGEGAWTQLVLARAYRQKGRHEEALAAALRALQRSEDRGHKIWALRETAYAQVALGRPGEALEAYRAVAELTPDDAVLQATIGNLLRELGDPAEAARHYRKAVGLPGTKPVHRLLLASALRDAGECAEGLEALTTVIAQAPEGSDLRQAALALKPAFEDPSCR